MKNKKDARDVLGGGVANTLLWRCAPRTAEARERALGKTGLGEYRTKVFNLLGMLARIEANQQELVDTSGLVPYLPSVRRIGFGDYQSRVDGLETEIKKLIPGFRRR